MDYKVSVWETFSVAQDVIQASWIGLFQLRDVMSALLYMFAMRNVNVVDAKRITALL